MKRQFSFSRQSFFIDGREQFMVSGEFHYFRVPPEDWRRRMRLFREAGGNCIATYVPWMIHEPEEGDIRFGDIPSRDLKAFLETAQEEGLMVVLRPGPYQYSELRNSGLPDWLLQNYPGVVAKDIRGNVFNAFGISYLHPVLLEKARVYFRAFADVVRPYMLENGGPVCMLQVDNELTGIHVWFGSLDYNPECMGFGKADGRYPVWLKNKYGSIKALNAAYETQFPRFEDVFPLEKANPERIGECRFVKDYADFYRSTIAEYALILAGWLREDGLHSPICHNSANPGMNCDFPEMAKAMGENFLLGSDHYYNLNANWAQNSPTPQYALRVMMSVDTMRAMGMPPSVLEMPGGSPSDTPPILKEDLLACYMANLALGVKGVNFYVYTGGPNFPGTGDTCEIYDYNAHIRADGRMNETYESLKAFGEFMQAHPFLQSARRTASVQVGFEWNTLRSNTYDYARLPETGLQARTLLERGVLYTLMCSAYSPEMVLLTGELDITRPLIVPCPSMMSEKAQNALIDFMNRGGQAMLLPVIPETDEDYRPRTELMRLLKGARFSRIQPIGPAADVEGAGRVFGIRKGTIVEELPEGAHAIARDVYSGKTIGFELAVGKGKLIFFGGAWELTTFDQAAMLESLMARLGGKKCVYSENRNIFTSLLADARGNRTLFAMNLFSGAQKTTLHVYAGGECTIENICLAPMEVRKIALEKE